jgi:hypothetical protein
MADKLLTHTLHIRVSPEIHAAITRAADAAEVKESAVCRRLIRAGLEISGDIKPRKAKRGGAR